MQQKLNMYFFLGLQVQMKWVQQLNLIVFGKCKQM